MFPAIRKCLLLPAIFLAGFLTAQQICPEKSEIKKKELFDRIFGGADVYYCLKDIKAVSVQNKKFIGKWRVITAKRKTTFCDNEGYRRPKTEHYSGQVDGIRSISFNDDRSATYTCDSAANCRMTGVFWAYLKHPEILRAYIPGVTTDSSAYDWKSDNCILQFQVNKEGHLEAFSRLEVRHLSSKKLILGSLDGRDYKYDTEIIFRKEN